MAKDFKSHANSVNLENDYQILQQPNVIFSKEYDIINNYIHY